MVATLYQPATLKRAMISDGGCGLHPRIAELVDYAGRQRATLLSAVACVPEPLRDRRVEAGRWSVAEVLEHLHRVERSIARLLAHGLERARSEGIGPERR